MLSNASIDFHRCRQIHKRLGLRYFIRVSAIARGGWQK